MVNFASAPLYRAEIEAAGLGFLSLPPDWHQELFVECMRELDRQRHPILLLRQIYRSGLSFMPELLDTLEAYVRQHDILLGSYLFPQYRFLCERQGKVFGVVNFCHAFVPNRCHPPDGIAPLHAFPKSWQRAWNHRWWAICDRFVTWAVNDVVKALCRQNGFPPMRRFLREPADLCLIGVSEKLMKPDDKLDPRFQFTGYLRWQAPVDATLEETLRQFTQGEKIPVLTFGSVSFDHVQEVLGRFQKHWPVGKKIILQSGWAGLSVDISRAEIKIIPKVSHDQLFQHASVVIHHGGAGTTASVLHAGKPQIVVPHFGDQHFWGKQVQRLGVGTTLAKKKWPEMLPAVVDQVLSNPALQRNALTAADTLRSENGPQRAVEVIENHLRPD